MGQAQSLKKTYLYDGLLLLIIFAITYLQNRYIGFYHDDYGYASLSYALPEPVGEVTFANVLHYLKWHYMHWGGRILFFFFGINAMQLGMQGFMCVQSIIVAIILFISCKLLCIILDDYSLRTRSISATVFVSLYLLFNMGIYRDSMYWATASIIYVWPMVCLMGALSILYFMHQNNVTTVISRIAVCLLLFMSAFSQEQIGLATLLAIPAFIFFVLGKDAAKQKFFLFGAWIATLAGFLLLYCAPGNYVRMIVKNEPLPGLWEIILHIPQNTAFIFTRIGVAECIILLCLCLGLCMQALRGNTTAKKTMPFMLMACATLGVIYIAPIKGARLVFPAVLLLSFTATIFLAQFLLTLTKTKHARAAFFSCTLLFIFAASMYFINTFYGYYRNYPAVLANDINLREAARNTNKIQKIIFYKLPYLQHAGGMPYRGKYIEPWIKNYYGLPKDSTFIYKTWPPHSAPSLQP